MEKIAELKINNNNFINTIIGNPGNNFTICMNNCFFKIKKTKRNINDNIIHVLELAEVKLNSKLENPEDVVENVLAAMSKQKSFSYLYISCVTEGKFVNLCKKHGWQSAGNIGSMMQYYKKI